MAKPTRTPMTTDRVRTIGVRVTPQEYQAITKRAAAVGLQTAPYVRMLALRDAAEKQD